MFHRLVLLFIIVVISCIPATAQAGPVAGFNNNVNSALTKERVGDSEGAKAYWAEVARLGGELLAEAPENSRYLFGTARAYYGLGEYARAVELYESLVAGGKKIGVPDMNRRFAWAWVYLGLAEAKLGNADKALAAWEHVPSSIGPVYTTIKEKIALLKSEKLKEAK